MLPLHGAVEGIVHHEPAGFHDAGDMGLPSLSCGVTYSKTPSEAQCVTLPKSCWMW
jgi:hypothetical protein